MNLRKILVPIDFSEHSEHAADLALILAKQFDASITLLHAVTLHHEDSIEDITMERYQERLRNREEKLIRKLAPAETPLVSGRVVIDSELIRGFSASDTILEYVAEHSFDLVVMGTHGQSGFKKWMYGSVTQKVLRLSSVPVLTTKTAPRKAEINRILVAVDFSDYSRRAIDAAKEIAGSTGAHLLFLHVVEQTIHPSFYAANFGSVFELNPEAKVQSTVHLKSFVGPVPANTAFLATEGRAVKEIVAQAALDESDLIVMATRGLSGLEHWLVGSTTERVVQAAEVPVWVSGQQDQ